LVIPLLSLAILAVGIIHLGECSSQPYLPLWHIVAGASGINKNFFFIFFHRFSIINVVIHLAKKHFLVHKRKCFGKKEKKTPEDKIAYTLF